MPQQNIQYHHRHQIDDHKWDACIQKATGAIIYAHRFYLDSMAPNWGALVLNDYEAVMPLPWKKKWGITYLPTIPFIQQLGVFAAETPTPELVQAFLAGITAHFRLGEVYCNYNNPVQPQAIRHTNYILPLNEPYTILATRYKGDLIRNLEKAKALQLTYTAEVDMAMALETFRQTYQEKMTSVSAADYQRFEQLCQQAQQKGALLLRGVKSETGQWLATALMPKDEKRIYLLQSATLPAGRKTSANHFLLDQVIREFAGTGIDFDFEGSDIPGIAHFYANFGSINQPYFEYRFNTLPWWIRWAKGN